MGIPGKRVGVVIFGYKVKLPRSGDVYFIESQEEARRVREALRMIHPQWFKARDRSRATV